MAIMDATPQETPQGTAVASGASLTALIETLITQNLLNKTQVLNIFTSAQREVSRTQNSPAHAEARVFLKRLLKRFPVA